MQPGSDLCCSMLHSVGDTVLPEPRLTVVNGVWCGVSGGWQLGYEPGGDGDGYSTRQ